MDQELIAYFDERFRETLRQIGELHEEVDKRFDQVDQRFDQVDKRFEGVEATARQTLVLVEGVRHEVHLIAEAFLGLEDRLKRVQAAIPEFEQIITWIDPHYRTLDTRVRVLEEQADRRQEDVMEAVRRSLAKPPLAPPAPE